MKSNYARGITDKTIWSSQQNHPQLVVNDCIEEFNLSESQAETLRFILMNRGINKWLYNRTQFIQLKHKTKALLKQRVKEGKDYRDIQFVHETLQNICKTPRWVEWDSHISRKMSNNIKKVVIKGRHC